MIFRKYSLRDHVENILGPDEGYKFAKWAFGDGFEEIVIEKLWILWNKRHGNKFMIYGHSQPENDIPKMIQIWKQNKDYNI